MGDYAPILVSRRTPMSRRFQVSFQLLSIRVMCFLCFLLCVYNLICLVFSPNIPCPPIDRWSACYVSYSKTLMRTLKSERQQPSWTIILKPWRKRDALRAESRGLIKQDVFSTVWLLYWKQLERLGSSVNKDLQAWRPQFSPQNPHIKDTVAYTSNARAGKRQVAHSLTWRSV